MVMLRNRTLLYERIGSQSFYMNFAEDMPFQIISTQERAV
jgi:hypothetical protein